MNALIKQDMDKVSEILQTQGKIKGLKIIRDDECVIPGGGKMLRPLLVALSARMCGYDGEAHIDYAAALEMLHNATLFHDDVIDSGELRRGQPTLNSRFDNTFAILSGDYLIARSLILIAKHERPDIFSEIAACIDSLVYGELKEMDLEKDLSCSLEDYMDVNDMKTASLFKTCMTVGALVADADSATLEILASVGMKVGSLFQLADDIMDYLGSEKKTGKKQFQDLREGKMTLPAIIYLQSCGDDEKRLFKTLVGNPDVTEEQGRRLLDRMDAYGVVERLNSEYAKIHREADELVQKVDGAGLAGDFRDLMDRIAGRVYEFMEERLVRAKAV